MADIVYAAPFAWDADKEEHIYCTDGLVEWPFIDVWMNPVFLAHYAPDETICRYGCCIQTDYCPPEVPDCNPCANDYEFTNHPGGWPACCPPEGTTCSYSVVKAMKGKVKVYLASGQQDRWIKLGEEININWISEEYPSLGDAWTNAYKAFDDRSRIIESFNLESGGSVLVKDSFRGFGCGVDPIFGYEGLPGATGYGSKANFEGFDIPPTVLAEQKTHNLDHQLYTTQYGLYFIAVGDITMEYRELCGGEEEDRDVIVPPIFFNAGLKETRIMDDLRRVCMRELIPGKSCTDYEVVGANFPLDIGASGPASWNTPQKFRERALFSAARSSCKYIMESVSISGETDTQRQFINPWTGVLEDAGEYQFIAL